MTNKELLSQFYTDLASGYIHKFGYDEFVDKVTNKALELNPNSITANMNKANFNTETFKNVVRQLKLTKENKDDIQKYPKAVTLLNEMNKQYEKIEDLGFQPMSVDAYEKWLGSLKEIKNKQESERLVNQFKGLVIKKTKG
jgi:hypothetical protein